MTETDVVGKLWGFCNTLRHDGIGYGDYIEQLTYLLFLKMADERKVSIPEGYDWDSLKKRSGTDLTSHYSSVLEKLSKEGGMLGGIFARSLNRFREPVNLKKLISMIDGIEWSEIGVDIKAEAYEGLLAKYAETQKGAGQYFTPREVIKAVVRCMKPDIRKRKNFTVHDPACGTSGFLIGAYEWMLSKTKMGAELSREEIKRLRKHTFSGAEIVPETRKLALMNMYLHEIESEVYYEDSLAEGPQSKRRFDCILTNPPFGVKSGGNSTDRPDFAVRTSNKQLNFVQHVMTTLKVGGRAAMVVPDNVLFESGAGKAIRKILMEDCNLHTILRLPIGTFTPYSPGVKANVIFFTKGSPTENVWIYDVRTDVKKITKSNPIASEIFEDFVVCYGPNPNVGKGNSRKEQERFRKLSREEISQRAENLDIGPIDESLNNAQDLQEPEEILAEIAALLRSAVMAADELQDLLGGNSNPEV